MLLQILGKVATGQEDCKFECKIILEILGLSTVLVKFEIN